VITGDKLSNYDWLVENAGKMADEMLDKTVKETSKLLQEKVMGIEETGPTALGPAVLTSVALASKGKPGSTVVICTDGLSNTGLGAYDEAKTDEQIEKVNEFYERVGQLAKSHGVTINLVSIKGDECNIDGLSSLCDLTGGQVERVSPDTLTKNFANILSKPVIATNVIVRTKLHKGL
jgi:Mg-chelatase subunit ChlD